MLISLDELIVKYNLILKGILHVGAHDCEEIEVYEKYISRDKILWIEAMENKVITNLRKFKNIHIESAVVSDVIEEVQFNVSNNGQSSSILELGVHKIHHPHIHYVKSFKTTTKLLKDIIDKYNINFNFINLDIQGAELKALKGMDLKNIDYIYTEVNCDYVYVDCSLVEEIDSYLSTFGFSRVETCWCEDYKWGDAFYIKNK
jgi:FkbM family methyltransferase